MLHLHCLAADPFHQWLLVCSNAASFTSPGHFSLTSSEAEQVLDMLSFAWAPKTLETYGAVLLIFHIFCDQCHPPVSDHLHSPASTELLLPFISTCAARYSGGTLSNYFYSVCAWHTLHSIHWMLDDTRTQAELTAAAHLAPPMLHHEKCKPVTVSDIEKIREQLDLTIPLNATFFACLMTTFWSISCLGKFTVKNIQLFGAPLYVKQSDVTYEVSSDPFGNLPVMKFHISITKCSDTGESVCWAPQDGTADPAATLANHFAVNGSRPNDHLFVWCSRTGL